jgi:predicted XRE-type DNA-binding protein
MIIVESQKCEYQINERRNRMEELKFKAYCVSHKIRQGEIAELLDIALPNVNEKLNGKQAFTIKQIKILCEHYGISAEEYFF